MNQVKSKKEANIQIAYKNGDWDTISKLLNQSYENARRKDRYYQVLSLNYPNINSQGQISELENFIASSTLTPIECLLLKERQIEVNKVAPLHYEVVSNAHYSGYLEYGTRYMAKEPFMFPTYQALKNSVHDDLNRLLNG